MAYPSKISLPAITQAAVHVATTAGFEALGVRAVADVLGVRPSALSRYCGDYAGLISLVAEHAAGELITLARGSMDGLPAGERHPERPFIAMAQAYRAFAESQPALYAALVSDTTGSTWPHQQGSARKALWELLLRVVGELTGDADDTGAAVAVWSFMHGFAHLHHAGLFGASGPRDGFDRGIAALVVGLTRAAPTRAAWCPATGSR
jgi:AcrR family transcriptional regulator